MFNKQQLIENAVERLGRQIENATGFQINIDTLTGIKSRVTEQKFYEVVPSLYMPIEVGESPWAEDRLTYKSFSPGGDFEEGIIETGTNNGRLSRVDTQVEGIRVPRKVWGKTINYNIPELAQAQIAGNWSLVEQKESSRYKNWQLGIQKIAFLGSDTDTRIKGLLTQTNVTSNLTVITKKISDMTPTEFQAFLASVIDAYWQNSNSTVYPDTFVIPSDDFNGLATSVDETYPLKTRLQRIREAFMEITGNQNFKVLQLAYGQSTRNDLSVERYALYRQDPESITMEIPVDYTTTIQDTINGFQYESVGYGQFSGVEAFRPEEMLYFDY